MESLHAVLAIGASLFGGGAMGALITQVVTARRRRPLSVGFRTTIYPVLKAKPSEVKLHAKVVVDHENSSFEFENLFVAHTELVNRGPIDHPEFPFGVTLPSGDHVVQAIFAEGAGADRHHSIDVISPVSPDSLSHEVDFKLTPFNRGDIYSVRTYMVVRSQDNRDPTPEDVELSSSVSAKFIHLPTVSETLMSGASVAARFALQV